jgi:hypothetical protein
MSITKIDHHHRKSTISSDDPTELNCGAHGAVFVVQQQ